MQTAILSLELGGGETPITAPEFIELIPAGPRVDARDGRWFLNDRPEDVLTAFTRRGLKLPIDVEHATEIKGPQGEFAGAVGWVEWLEIRQGAIWGRVNWNDHGRWLIEDRSYRYISPVFSYNDSTNRVIELTSVALTNQPALKLTALFRAQTPAPHIEEDEKMPLKVICRALGLTEGTSEENILGAIDALKDDNKIALARAETPSLKLFVPRADHDLVKSERDEARTALARAETEARDNEIEALVAEAVEAGKVTPATKSYYVAQCRADGGVDLFKEFIKSAPKVVADTGLDGKEPGKGGDGLDADQKAICSMLGVSEEEFKSSLADA